MSFDKLSATLLHPYFSWITALNKAYPQAEIFLVGGAVRDATLGRESKDYDFVVRGVQARHLQEFLGTQGIVNFVGRVFGVYKFVPDVGYEEFKAAGFEAFDIALPRTEHAWGTGGYRDVEVQSDHELPIEEDLARRDFTINAVALELIMKNEELRMGDARDPYAGMKDIEGKVIRAVGEAKTRFQEDYTRILRAIRFACQLGFEIEPATFEALQNIMPQLNDMRGAHEYVAPREVVAKELLKAFYADSVRAFSLYDTSGAFEQLMPELLKMKDCPQPEEYHSEGDVWMHTKMALKNLGTGEYAKVFGVPAALESMREHGQPANLSVGLQDGHYNALLVIAVLLHDVGKPPMLRTPEEHGVDRIRFDEHDTVGAEIAREIGKRLALSSMPEDGPLHVNVDKLAWLIKHHLLLLHSEAEDMKASTVEKYFFNQNAPGEELLRLMFCDGSATIPKGTEPTLQNLFNMMARIKRMESMVKGKRGLPKPLINGDEIMELLHIPSGPGVGEVVRALREEQLSARVATKEEAQEWLKNSFGS